MSRVNLRKHFPFNLGAKNQTAVGIAHIPAVVLNLGSLSSWEKPFSFSQYREKSRDDQSR
ncbi:hypothetical protein SAMN05660706_1695 [Desulfoscipio geothermicus DSM 3669]|uniref:Uncharacterized protein n=1 Tax=Desulfoscipio geothermicus DSM 3669 TaxID=1121426 RepID=A0A1I6ELZ4_9FIRM|nr:hypothetical protein SAMN05660706_1695 [Desulfoscipio geothermicus DSM 3669]